MIHAIKDFRRNNLRYALTVFLAIMCFLTYDLHATVTDIDNSIDVVMEEGLPEADVMAFIPEKKPDYNALKIKNRP
jgi:hypothetical protein